MGSPRGETGVASWFRAECGLAGKEAMGPLLFVNWSSVNAMFRGLMWLCAIVLATVIVVHLSPSSPAAHHAVRLLR